MTSCIVPVYQNDEHISSSGMDILLDHLIDRAEKEILPGTSNIILSKEGDIIVHPDFNEKISMSKSILKVSEANDPLLTQIFNEILKHDTSSYVRLLPDSKLPYVVAFGKIDGPEWYYITLYNKEEIWSGVLQGVRIVFLSALLTLLIELFIVFYTLTRNVKNPLLQLIGPIKSMMQGDFTKSIDESNVREVEEIRQAFNKMQGTIAKQIDSLKASKKAVEQEIEIRKQAEEDRLIAYNQLQNIMNSAILVSIIATDTEGIITHFNSGAQQMLGYSENEIVGKQSPAIWHIKEEVIQHGEAIYEEYGERVQGFDVFKYEIVKGKKYLKKEWTYIKKDGSQLLVNLAITSVRNSKNEIVGFLGVALDITKQKSAENALIRYKENLEDLVKEQTKVIELKNADLLRLSNERYRSIIKVSNTGAWEYNKKTDSLWCSSEYFIMLGHDPVEFAKNENMTIENAWIKLLHPDDLEKTEETFANYLENGSEGMYENYFRMKHRDGSWVWIWSRGQTLRNQDSSLTDITVGTHINITEQKEAEKELIAYKENLEDLVKQRTKDLEAATEAWKTTSEELTEKNHIINGQNEELKSTLQNLKETQAQLFQAEKMASLGILTAGVAHEINNPLNYIMGAYVGLRHHLKNNTFSENREQVETLIKALKSGVDRSSAIIKGLNQFSRKSESHEEDCELHSIIDNALLMLNNQIKYNINIEKDYSTPDLTIKGNVGNLHQVFTNIIGNAVQAIVSDGTIKIKTESLKSKVVITISDTGSGISPEHLEKITDPFFTTKAPGEGTGLGLAITYNIIKEHKGKLEFSSYLEKGTTVRIELPKKSTT